MTNTNYQYITWWTEHIPLIICYFENAGNRKYTVLVAHRSIFNIP